MGIEMNAITTHDASCFLATMLQGMQPQRRVGSGVFVPENTENAAFFVEVIAIWGMEGVRCDHDFRSTWSVTGYFG